ncbi:hypothetical protein FRC11_012348 [Ceratobasidium sp. 423]|nr:hypothetical protein FRC11_012348 [Ceratobasidium sp. 423]
MATDERGSATPARTPTPGTDKPRLTSLEYLQLTQRSGRGSITDPSLHVSHPPASPKRQASPLRMRSPGATSVPLRMIQQVNELTLAGSKRRERDEDEAADSPGPGLRPSQVLDFNYNMRRHSIAAVPREMKDLFDELRDHLPADRGMKASKWEILSKAVDYIGQLKQSYAEVSQELDMVRHELETLRPGSITGHHHPAAPHHPHPHPGYALPYGAYSVSNHYPVQPGGGLPPPPTGGPQPPPA